MSFVVYYMCIFFVELVASNPFSKQQFYDLHRRMEDIDIEKTFGVDTPEKVPEYEVVSPYQADEFGNLLDYSLRTRTRTRRNTNEANFWFFKVEAFGRSIHMNLTKVKPHITSTATVHTVHTNGSSTYKEIPRGVYYTGHVKSDPGSLVAINENNGLAGLIRTFNDTLYINPLPFHVTRSIKFTSGQPHVIYRQSIEEFSSANHISEDGGHRIKREKPNRQRQAQHKYLEMALVADNFAISAYDENEMTFHLLAIAHITTQLYHDSSIGSIKITPVIVQLVLKKDGFGYNSSSSKTERINAMESWAKENFPVSDSDPGHADVVVLITRRSSGGIASLGTTCRSTFGSALSNDIGVGSALIVTHELAHTMGVGHDDSSSGCANHVNLMASTISIGPGSMKWSACSRERFQDFLSHRSNCLDDIPPISAVIQDVKEFYGKLPGQVIDRAEQCEMAFGDRFYPCPQRLTSCQALGCTEDGHKCYFSSTSPVDGTRCGDRHWCINGICTDDGSQVINGRWSNWSAYTKCTRSCGGGVQSRTRTCNNPAPKNGGKNCIGPVEGHWRICNPKPCPAGSKSYRQLQCEEIDPDYSEYFTSDECSLTCRKGNYAYPQHRLVNDGTRCTNDPTSKDVCIRGKCRHVPCDDKLESGLKRDRCGVCGGDSSKCRFVERKWNEKCPGFGPDVACTIFEVPIGSTSVYVEQDTPDRNLLGIKDQGDRYVIPIPTWSKMAYAAGTEIHYYHEKDIDINTVYIPGPTTEKLTIVFVPGYPKTGVWYEFYDPTLISNVGIEDLRWNMTSWGKCSRKCATGKERRIVECLRIDDGTYVGHKLCLQKSRRPAKERLCNTHPCQPVWFRSEWSSCSRTCGKGVQKRQIHCRRKISPIKYEILPDSSCRGNKPPGDTTRSCNEIICHVEWKATAWSQCSSTCGGGFRNRSLVCKRLNDKGELVIAPELLCHYATKPLTTMRCNMKPCPTPVPLFKYRGLGCFNDGDPHAIPIFVKSFRSNIDWTKISETIEKCAEFIHNNYPKNKVFGIKFYGECWTGNKAKDTYDMYEASADCWNKVGKDNTYYVYEFY